MRIKRKKTIAAISILVIAASFIGYYLFSISEKEDGMDIALPSGQLDDEMIIVPMPEAEDKSQNFIDKLLDRIGIISIDDGEVPLAGLSFNARDAGMIPDDKSKALHNANLLIKTLNVNSKIVIDGKYYITTPTESLATRDVEIIGTEDAEIIADNGNNTKLFDPAFLKNISIKNVRFTNLNSNNTFVIIYNPTKTCNKVDKVDIQKCTFTGNISLYRQSGDNNIDPDQVDFGIGDFIFRNNNVSNTKLSFIVLIDTPVDYCEITGNTVKNFTYKFFNLSITNESPYSSKFYDHVSYLKVENNIVICEDDWWGETSSGSYYTFILFEGNEVFYNNNHVEGMKAREDFAVYDAYLSARVVNYTNNTWKNNICFAPRKVNNTLLKSKGGGAKPLVRNYTGNTFIVDEEFAERVGQSKENLYVYFISLTQYAESYNISNNLFDVYELRFPASSAIIRKLTFSGNTVRAKKASGNLTIVRTDDNYDVDSIDIHSNTIDLGEKADQSFNLIKMVDAGGKNRVSIKKISVSNNNISAPFGYLLYNVWADNVTFTGNNIVDKGNEYSGFAYGGRFISSNISDNSIISKNSVTFYEGRQLYGEGKKSEVLNISRNNFVSGNNGMYLDANYSSDTPTIYTRYYTFSTAEGTHKFYYTFKLGYNPLQKCAEVTFTNNKGETKTYMLGNSDTTINGHGQYIELIGQDEAESNQAPFKVRFFNNKDGAGFYITEYSRVYAELMIETVSSEA